jgi:hypothetical protein
MEFIVADETEQTQAVQVLGPFPGEVYRLIVDGCRVPYVELHRQGGTEFDWCLVVDGRFAADVNEEEIMRWAYAFANAMAVSAGYTNHGPNSLPCNPHAQQVREL